MEASREVTALLAQWSHGNREALNQLIPVVYQELHRIAERHLRRERSDHTLRPTALVHEAYLKLSTHPNPDWQDRNHFFAVAARIMRHVLINYAKARRAKKRGAGMCRITLDERIGAGQEKDWDIARMDRALRKLEALDPRKNRIVELRFFAGMKNEEIAEILGVSLATVNRDWRMAKAWLYTELKQHPK